MITRRLAGARYLTRVSQNEAILIQQQQQLASQGWGNAALLICIVSVALWMLYALLG
jgi:hypothetical protein